MSVLVATCIIYARVYCYPPLPAEAGRKGDYKTTTWVIVGGRTGARDFLNRLPPFNSPSVGIINSVLDLSYSHARTHLNTLFSEIICLKVSSVVHFWLLVICFLQIIHLYTVNYAQMWRGPFVTTILISLDFWNWIPVKLWESYLQEKQSLGLWYFCSWLLAIQMDALHPWDELSAVLIDLASHFSPDDKLGSHLVMTAARLSC